MKQEAHSWIAVRAIALLDGTPGNEGLVDLLKPHVCEASVGAWIPDSTAVKSGGSATENHVFKMGPLAGPSASRFVSPKADLVKRLGPDRRMSKYLSDDVTLDSKWWSVPYKAEPLKPGYHLPNRAMALSTMLRDLLLLGDKNIGKLVNRDPSFDQYLVQDARTTEEAAAASFFMLSHFLADACMPCHSDGRNLSDYGNGLHKEWEESWSRLVVKDFKKDSLMKKGAVPTACKAPDELLALARSKDAAFNVTFSTAPIPVIPAGRDVWMETVDVCRGSFALASIVAPPGAYPYNAPDARAPFSSVLDGKPILGEMNAVIMHDAVLNTAIVWQDIWQAVKK